jgi:hypothetical protein
VVASKKMATKIITEKKHTTLNNDKSFNKKETNKKASTFEKVV